MRDDEAGESPPAVVAAVALGTAPLPFLAVYAVIFIVHGGLHRVQPPDVTSTSTGELVAGIIAAVAFVVLALSLVWLLGGIRRWLFALVQLAVLGIAVDFVVDPTTGGTAVSAVLVLTSVAALLCAFHPQAWGHVDRAVPDRVARLYGARIRLTRNPEDLSTR